MRKWQSGKVRQNLENVGHDGRVSWASAAWGADRSRHMQMDITPHGFFAPLDRFNDKSIFTTPSLPSQPSHLKDDSPILWRPSASGSKLSSSALTTANAHLHFISIPYLWGSALPTFVAKRMVSPRTGTTLLQPLVSHH